MAFDISLSSGMRADLTSLQGTATLLNRTQGRLSSGKSVNSAVDDPSKYFKAQDHTSHAGDLAARKSDMGEAIQAVKAANQGITSITALINQAQGLVQSAQSANTTTRASLAAQFNTLRTQINQLASDSGYNGKNFLQGDTLKVLFNETGSSSLTVTGFTGNAVGLGITTAATGKASLTATYANELLGNDFTIGNQRDLQQVGQVGSVTVTQLVNTTASTWINAGVAATSNGRTVALGHAGVASNVTIYETLDATSATVIAAGNASATAVTGTSLTNIYTLAATIMTAANFDITVSTTGGYTFTASEYQLTYDPAGHTMTVTILAATGADISIDYSWRKTLAAQVDYTMTSGGAGTAAQVTFKRNFTTATNIGSDYTFSGTVAAARYAVAAGTGAGHGTLTFVAAVTGTVRASYTNASDSQWGTNASLQIDYDNMNNAISKLRTQASTMAANLSVITTRQDWSQGMINNLQIGSDNLTLADMNEEGANMLALQTRQQLGIQALSLASQANQSIMRLFG